LAKGSKFDVDIHGVPALSAALKKIASRFGPTAEQALEQEARDIMDLSMDRTPVDKGVLRASHTVTIETPRDEVKATIGVGGPAAPYAIPVHEIGPDRVTHKNGRWKFLQSAMEDMADGIGDRIRDRIRANRGLG
jgi:hypothetical protein